MDSFSINLSEAEEKGGKFKRFFALLGIILIVSWLAIFALYHIVNKTLFFVILAGNALQVLYFIYLLFSGYKTKMFINSDDYALEFQFSMVKKVPEQVIWQTLKKIRIGPTYIAFYKRTGKRKVIQLGWLPYTKVVDIKEKVQLICRSKGIEVEIAEYHVG
jgi:hypothetical protein